ncbi:mCG63843, isoform CRA_b [Mus musculus]|nr:mCG63843, isoform CRA_b [Mus musculus]
MPWKRSPSRQADARPWPEVGTDGISCSVCGPGPHCLGEFHEC